MRIVEYQNPTTVPPYRWLERFSFAAAVFTALIVLLMFANFVALKLSDPIHAPALLKLTEELKRSPQDGQMKEQIRDLDFLARRAFFSSQHFEQIATYLLAIGALATVISFKALQTYRQRLPYPGANPPRENLTANALWARRAISAAGLLLVGLAISLSLPCKSPLDKAPAVLEKAKTLPSPTAEEFALNWPGFLGAARGHSLATELPIVWDGKTGQEILWKTEIPKPGRSSPVVWNDRVFLTAADAESREIYCLDAKTGSVLWKHQASGIAGSPKEAPEVTEDATLAAPTAVTDGTRVFAIFGTGDLLALDFQGKRLWAQNLGVPENSYGHGSSLVLANDTVFVQMDQAKNSALFAIVAATGETRWKIDRPFKPSWASPLVAEINAKKQVILAAAPGLARRLFQSCGGRTQPCLRE